MSQNIQQGLMITAIGMGLVFAVIIFLWGVMALMMRLTSGEKTAKKDSAAVATVEEETLPILQADDRSQRAAAAAVAVVLGLEGVRKRKASHKTSERSKGQSPWQTVHRMQQVDNKRARG